MRSDSLLCYHIQIFIRLTVINVRQSVTSGVAPAALTVATAMEISAAARGSIGWRVCALTIFVGPVPEGKSFSQYYK